MVEERDKEIADKNEDIVELKTQLLVLRRANDEAIDSAVTEAVVVEKKVIDIKKVYVPQIEYINRYIGDKNETDCKRVDGLLKSFVY